MASAIQQLSDNLAACHKENLQRLDDLNKQVALAAPVKEKFTGSSALISLILEAAFHGIVSLIAARK